MKQRHRHSSSVPTQLFGAGQEALLVRQDVVEDEKLRRDGVALSHAAAAALPLLARHTQSNTSMSGDNIKGIERHDLLTINQ